MSNTVKARQKVYSLDRYRKSATKAPFPLQVDDDKTIFIAAPSAGTMLDLAEKLGGVEPDPSSVRDVLQGVLGEQYDEVMGLLANEDFTVLMAFIQDLMEYFDLGGAIASLS